MCSLQRGEAEYSSIYPPLTDSHNPAPYSLAKACLIVRMIAIRGRPPLSLALMHGGHHKNTAISRPDLCLDRFSPDFILACLRET